MRPFTDLLPQNKTGVIILFRSQKLKFSPMGSKMAVLAFVLNTKNEAIPFLYAAISDLV